MLSIGEGGAWAGGIGIENGIFKIAGQYGPSKGKVTKGYSTVHCRLQRYFKPQFRSSQLSHGCLCV